MKTMGNEHRRRKDPPTRRFVLLAVLAAAGPASAGRVADEAPGWLRAAAALPLSADQAAAPAVVLLDESTTTVGADGTAQTSRRYAARLRTREGREAGMLHAVYLTDTGRIRAVRGWIIRPSGETQTIGSQAIADIALALNDVYNEARMRLVSAGDAEPDTVFGAEITSEDRAIFTQIDWPMQSRWPVVSVRRTLTVPAAWAVSSLTFNHDPVEPATSGGTRTWTMNNLPEVADEPAAPSRAVLVPRIAVSYTPTPRVPQLAVFDSWPSVSRWFASLADPPAAPSASVTARARDLAATATDAASRAAAIAAWVQRVPYISIQIGLGRGGGYRPRAAADVLARNHGDCKDKATLMRAMLAAVGIRSYPAAVYAGDRTAVRDAWPSPHEFNHVILAIVIDDADAYAGARTGHPTLGSLVFFDPTDPHTRIGALPSHEEGSLALVVHPEGSGLVRLPNPGAAGHESHRTTDAVLQADGTLEATIIRRATGKFAAARRALATEVEARTSRDAMTSWLNAALPGARVSDVSSTDGADAFEDRTTVTVPRAVQALPGNLAMMVPPFRVLDVLPPLASARRTLPIDLDGFSASETLRLELPPGMTVDELIETAMHEGPYGSYRLVAREEGHRLIVERRLVLERTVVPPSEYAALKQFLDGVRSFDSSPIVLKRQSRPTEHER